MRSPGVLPSGTTFTLESVSAWSPPPHDLIRANPEWLVTRMVARLLPGVTPDDLKRELDGLIVEFPERSRTDFGARAVGELT